MSEALGALPWWGWALLASGAIAVAAVVAALFLPDWHRPDSMCSDIDPPAGSSELIEALSHTLNVPILRGGEITVLQNGDAFFAAILEAIRTARETVNFEIYIFEPDGIGREFLDAFAERARAGVEVRIVVDAFGAWRLRRRHREELAAAGCRITRFRPLRLLTLARAFKRDHRRSIVIDGRTAFIGGAAIADKWTGDVRNRHEWRDSMFRVTGSFACGVQSAFADTWLYCTGEVLAGPRFFAADGGARRPDEPCGVMVVSSPGDAAQPIRLLFWLSMLAARERLFLSNSYFIPDRRIRDAVIERARVGVDVRVLVPGNHTDAIPVQWAGRGYYEELLAAGVRIFEFQPAMMHAKTAVIDGVWSIVGSANMDERSMELNEEACLAIADPALGAEIERGLLADFERSKEIDRAEWARRSPIHRGLEHLAKTLIEQY